MAAKKHKNKAIAVSSETEKEEAVLLSVSRLNTHCVVDVPISIPTLSSCSSRMDGSFPCERLIR